MRRSFAGCSAAILLGACSNNGSAVSDNLIDMTADNLAENLAGNPVVENSVETTQAPVAPRHRYDFKDSDRYGDIYGYLGAVSEEDQKKGVATPSVVRFRYTGFWQGAHHLQEIGDAGGVLESEECAVPCIAIKGTDYNGQVRRVGFSSSSIVGAAFEDAMNGQLQRSPAPGTVSGGYRFKGGNPSDAANWQPISPPAVPAQDNSADAESVAAENTF